MIDPTTLVGRALLVFFWGGLAANIVNAVWYFWHFPVFLMPWFYVFTNMALVTGKNLLIPTKSKK